MTAESLPPKYSDPYLTATGEARAWVALRGLETLWFNTGTLCNIACRHCYIESSPRNDTLVYLTAAEVATYLDEIGAQGLGTRTIGFTGGEPFMNRELRAMLTDALGRGFDVLVLTNAMAPLRQAGSWLPELGRRYGGRLRLRVSLDHFSARLHDAERGAGGFAQALAGLRWLHQESFAVDVAARRFSGLSKAAIRAGFATLFALEGIVVDALVVFPEMDGSTEVPEITTRCWDVLGKSPDSVMCASSRMVVKRKGAARPAVVSCTLLPYDERFELGETLAEAARPVSLNHPHCAKFCVLGGGRCLG